LSSRLLKEAAEAAVEQAHVIRLLLEDHRVFVEAISIHPNRTPSPPARLSPSP